MSAGYYNGTQVLAMPISPRMKWKLQRYSNSLEDRLERFRQFFRGALSKQKVCPACRALVSAQDQRCPFCNEPLSALHRVGVRRVAASILPDHGTYSTLLIGANFLLFGLSILAATKAGLGLAGMLGMPGRILVDLGANYGLLVQAGQYWRLLSGTFLHASLIHLLFNMLVLFDVGPAVEEMYGQARFLTLYVVSGVAGSLASYWWHFPFAFMVGASGALFGLIGVMIAYGYRHRTSLAERIKATYVRWAIYGLVFGFLMPSTDNAAHLGGLAAGVAFGYLVSDMPPVTREAILLWRVLNYACWLAIAISFLLVGLNYGRLR